MKGHSKPEIYFFLFKGLKPQEIMKLGYKPSTVYYYSRRWQATLEKLIAKGTISVDMKIKVKIK